MGSYFSPSKNAAVDEKQVWKSYYKEGMVMGNTSGKKLCQSELVDYYKNCVKKYEPGQAAKEERNLAKIPNLIAKFDGDNQDLVKKLCEKYPKTVFWFAQMARDHQNGGSGSGDGGQYQSQSSYDDEYAHQGGGSDFYGSSNVSTL